MLGQSGLSKRVDKPDDGVMPRTGVATLGPDPSQFLVTFPGLLRNVPVLENAAAGRGLFSILQERDGIVRRVPIVMRADDQIVPSLSFELLRVVANSGVILVKTNEAGVISVAVPGLTVPTDRNGRVWVHFSRPEPDIYVSAKDILEGKVAPAKSPVSSFWSARPPSACLTSRRRQWSVRCRAWKSTRKLLKRH